MQCVRQKLLQTISANCKREQSGMGSSQPCAMTETETAVMAIQPLGDTWRHYNPEGGERVMRKAMLARCEAGGNETGSDPHPTAAQHSRQKRQATGAMSTPHGQSGHPSSHPSRQP